MRPAAMDRIARRKTGRPGILEVGAADRDTQAMSSRDSIRRMPQGDPQLAHLVGHDRLGGFVRVPVRRQ
jgi:hypothetical protein